MVVWLKRRVKVKGRCILVQIWQISETPCVTPLVWMTIPAQMHQLGLNSLPATHIENWINPDQFINQLMGPNTAKGRIVMGGIVKKIRQQGMRPLFQQVGVVLLEHLINTSTPNKHWKGSVSCLMKGKRRGMLLASFQLYQPNKVKSGQYQTTNTYNKLIEPEQWNQASDLSGMNNLLNMLSSKNIKEKLGKDTQSMGNNGGGVSQTINTITTTGNISGNGTIQTAYPVKKDEASNVAINSLINATPLNSYGDLNNASFSK